MENNKTEQIINKLRKLTSKDEIISIEMEKLKMIFEDFENEKQQRI